MKPHILTFSGRRISVTKPRVEDINPIDIVYHLGNIKRFNGLIEYTVLQHSLHVCDLLPISLKPFGIIHDGHEAFLGDISSPVALHFIELPLLKRVWDTVIGERFGLHFTDEIYAEIRKADLIARATEARDLLLDFDPADLGIEGVKPDDKKIPHVDLAIAKQLFASRLKIYFGNDILSNRHRITQPQL